MTVRSLPTLLLVLALVPCRALAEDWPLFRGNPEQTGVSRTELPDTLKVAWKFKAKDGIEGTAAIAGGTAFIGSFDKHLYAIDMKSGKEKWSYKAGPFKAAPALLLIQE